MRVNQSNSPNVPSSEAPKKARGPSKNPESESSASASSSGGAKADISAKARDMASAKAAATSAPDVREERIAELRKRIQAGQYNVDPDAVADRMVRDHEQTAGI